MRSIKYLFCPFVFLLLFPSCKDAADKAIPVEVPDASDERYAEHVRTSEFQTPEEEMRDFILPPGFEVTLFASEPDITKPINMAFDEKGRLWVTQSSEYPIEAGPGQGTDRITILEDTDGDGKADKINDFVNDLNIPIGITPIKGGAIAYSIPNVYRFMDTDNDGKADQREVLLGEFEHKDTHGMVNNLFRGFDGWIHASHGFANLSVVAGRDGDSIRMFSGNTFRFRANGMRAEKTSDGRINPFGSDYDELGYHYSADCHTLPIYQLIWGGNYSQWGKQEPNMGFAPTMMDYGLNSTALSGLVYYTDTQFPEEYRNSFYSGDVVTCRISRNVIEFSGSTPTATRKEDFLISRDSWFRPVDIKIGPDGAMYIADFYNRIIGHYEVPLGHPGRDRVSGRIWKITYKGKQRKVTDWSQADLPALIKGLGHEVLDVRMTAANELIDRIGDASVPSLLQVAQDKNIGAAQLVQVLWALYRLDALPKNMLREAIGHAETQVRVHALRILAEYKELDRDQMQVAIDRLLDLDPHVQRVAAEVLGRHPEADNYPHLIRKHANVPKEDTHLGYTVLLAIRNHLLQEDIVQEILGQEWTAAEEALISLVISDVPAVYSARFLLDHLGRVPQLTDRHIGYVKSITRSLPTSEIGKLLSLVRKHTDRDLELQYKMAEATFQGMEQKGEKPMSLLEGWYAEIAGNILKRPDTGPEAWTDGDKLQRRYAAGVAGRYRLKVLEPALQKLFSDPRADEDTRSMIANALMDISIGNGPAIARVLYDGEATINIRRKMAQALGRSGSAQAIRLLGQGLKGAPMEIQEAIAAVLANREEGKTALMASIRAGDAPARLLTSRSVEEPLLKNITTAQKSEFDALTANIGPISEERQRLIEKRIAAYEPDSKGISAGKTIFSANCATCHQIDKVGGLIGPQLDGIGNWGLSALATKILDPNRNITESFRSYNITLKNGQTVTGLFRREEGQSLILANQLGEEFSVAKSEIKDRAASKYTLMPDNFHSVLGEKEFNELMVYLLNQK